MKKDVMIKIIGRQFVAGEEDSVELTTTGSYYRRNGDYFIRYEESEATGYKGAYTTVKAVSYTHLVVAWYCSGAAPSRGAGINWASGAKPRAEKSGS